MRKTFTGRALAAFALLAVTASTLVGTSTNPATATFGPRWTGTWATALTKASATDTSGSLSGFDNQSVRQIVRASVGGEKVRIRVSNEHGTQTLRVGHASVGLPAAPGSPDLIAGSIRELTFSGSESVSVPVGADALSDPVDLDVDALSELAVTLFLPEATGPTSWHWVAKQTAYVYSGDQAENASGAGHTRVNTSYYYLAGVDVASRSAWGSVVVLGDSIGDGYGSTHNANHRWPDYLAQRIVQTGPDFGDPGVLNESLSGNRVLSTGAFAGVGVNALARLDEDVFGQTGVRTAILAVGINDIQFAGEDADEIIAGLRQLAAQLREKGIRVVVCTLGPYEGYTLWTPEGEATRLAVNAYLRGSNEFNGLIDVDKVLRDPAQPSKVRPEFDAGDHIHPNDAGAEAIAAAVPLWLL